MTITSLAALNALCRDLPEGDASAAAAVAARQATLTKPPGSLGKLETLVAWLARWQRRPMPRLDRVAVLVFAGNHGVAARGVSPYPPEVTAQMVANFASGGAAINQLATLAGARLRVVPLDLDSPTADLSAAPAMDEAAFLAAVSAGHYAVEPGTDLLCLGEMGIGNTTAAAALAGGLLGGTGVDWAGRGTGVDDSGLARKARVVDAALARHKALRGDPLAIAAALGGRELAAILGAVPPPPRWRYSRRAAWRTAPPPTSPPRPGIAACWPICGWSRCSIWGCVWARRPAPPSQCCSRERRWRAIWGWQASRAPVSPTARDDGRPRGAGTIARHPDLHRQSPRTAAPLPRCHHGRRDAAERGAGFR
jgi:hypothetical protein